MHRCHLHQANQQAGNDTRQKQRADGNREHAAPDNHQNGRRNDHRQHGRYSRDGDREAIIIALPALRFDEDFGLRCGIRRAAAADARKENGQHNIDLREPAWEMPDQRAR